MNENVTGLRLKVIIVRLTSRREMGKFKHAGNVLAAPENEFKGKEVFEKENDRIYRVAKLNTFN